MINFSHLKYNPLSKWLLEIKKSPVFKKAQFFEKNMHIQRNFINSDVIIFFSEKGMLFVSFIKQQMNKNLSIFNFISMILFAYENWAKEYYRVEFLEPC